MNHCTLLMLGQANLAHFYGNDFYEEIECGKCDAKTRHYEYGDIVFQHCEECDSHLCDDCFDSRDETGDCGFCYECYLKTTDANKLKVKELKALCKSKGIKGYSKLKKQELLDLLLLFIF